MTAVTPSSVTHSDHYMLSTVPPPPPPPLVPAIVSFSASASNVQAETPVTLNWVTKDSAKVTLNGAEVAPSGSQVVSPLQTTVYTLKIYDANGTEKGQSSVTVNVTLKKLTIDRWEATIRDSVTNRLLIKTSCKVTNPMANADKYKFIFGVSGEIKTVVSDTPLGIIRTDSPLKPSLNRVDAYKGALKIGQYMKNSN